MRRPNRATKTDRLSRSFPADSKMWVSSEQTDLLYQDFRNRVVPYRHDPKAYSLSAEGILHYKVDRSLTLDYHEHKLDGFLRAVASRLLTRHEAWIEVSFGDVGRDRAPFGVSAVDGVRRADSGKLIQEAPPLDELPDWFREDETWETEIDLDFSRMVHVGLPADYPSGMLRQMFRDLSNVVSIADLASVMDPWESKRPGGALFESKESIRTRDLAITKAALPIGWTSQEISRWPNRETNEYYYYWRELHFLHFLASLRARAEEALSQVLTIAGEKCGFAASVTAQGVHTPQEVQEIIHKFEAGDLAFSSVNDIILENATTQHSKHRRVV